MTRKAVVISLLLLASCTVFASKILAQCILSEDDIRDFSTKSVFEFFLESDGYGASFAKWHRAISDAPVISVFNVSGHVPYEENIIKANLVTFTKGSTLEFMNVETSFWAIVTERLVFQGENITIARNANYTVPPQESAPPGSHGNNFHGRSGCCHGARGGNGGHGSRGVKGGSQNLPCLVVIAEAVELRNADPDTIFVRLPGIAGGHGGNGGRGGNGGQGEAGADASFGTYRCRRTPRDGGGGGNAGNGGPAGHGGDGGNGGDILYIGNRDDGVEFMSFQIFNEGGVPGQPGAPGHPGSPGKGGDRGHARGRPCFRNAVKGPDGSGGATGNQGSVGRPGKRGQEQIIAVTSLPYFN